MSESKGGERRAPIVPTNLHGGRTVVNYREGTSYELVDADDRGRRTQPSQERHHRRPVHQPEPRVAPEDRERSRAPRLPTTLEFWMRIARMRKAEQHEPLPPVPEHPTASDIARYAQIDWDHILRYGAGAQEGLASYVHGLADRMRTPDGYRLIGDKSAKRGDFSDGSKTPPISVGSRWKVEGNHRALALKVLGPEFIEKSGMNDWVKIKGTKP